MTGQDVQYNAGRRDVLRQSFGTGSLDSLQPICEDRTKDLDHLPVTTGLTLQLTLNATQRRWQFPLLEWGSVTQGAGFAHQYRKVM